MVALAPLWLVGTLHRGLWTPDEPREADIAWRMSLQGDRTLPQLAGAPFLEKPPLSYWLSAAAIDAFGDSPAAARAPNILFALAGALAVGALAYSMAGAGAAVLSALLAGTALIAFRVTVWLAPDAGLLAGCAIALWGAFVGFTSARGRAKLVGYSTMHLGAALGFMAKSAPGWLVPALTLIAIIAWERRWAELRRWELYAGFVLQALIIGPWVYAVALTPIGRDALLAFFWHNVVGRFTQVSGPAALDYTTGHHNWAGKYFLELPVYLFPWTLLAVAAIKRAWTRTRVPGADGTPWRFAIAAVLPFLVILSLAATARDIYAAPAMLGMSVLIALWAREAQGNLTRLDRFALRGTRALVAGIALVFAGFVLIADARAGSAVAVMAVAIVVIALRFSAQAQRRGDVRRSIGWTYGAYVGSLCMTALVAFPAVDQWQNLPRIAAAVQADTRFTSLGLLDPDETTLAILDHRLLTRSATLNTQGTSAEQVVADWIRVHGNDARVLVLLPGHGGGPFSDFMGRFRPVRPPGDGVAATLKERGVASIVKRYESPEGRRYALLGPPGS